MTKFSYEVPLAHLEDFDEYQDFIFALSFLCEDKIYKSYVKRKKKEGKFLILDNSYNELKIPDLPDTLARLFYDLEADLVISPDCNGWSLEDLRASYKEMTKLVSKEKILVVVKSREEYDMFMRGGAPHYCTTYEQRKTLPKNIVYLCYHFLGLLSTWEIRTSSPISCDTGMPIKLALEGKTIADWAGEHFPHLDTTPDFFNLTLTKEQLKLAKENIEWLNVALAL